MTLMLADFLAGATLYDYHPGHCCPRVEPSGVWSTCCSGCAGTGWFDATHPGEEPWGYTCVPCRGTGRALVTLAAPADPTR